MGRWEREEGRWKQKKEERWEMEDGSKDKEGRMEYWNDGLMGKSCARGSFIIPLFHYSNIPHRV
jgi:hypothetical protein